MIEQDRRPPELVFYDGTCGLCHAIIGLMVRFDRQGMFLFAPLGGSTFETAVPITARATLPDSVVVQRSDGSMLNRSRAVLHILRKLGGRWRVVAIAGSIVPRVVADSIYDSVAAARRRFFGSADDACPIVPPSLRSRFLD